MLDKQLAKNLAELIKKAQPSTSFQNGTVTYGDQVFNIPLPSYKTNDTTITKR